MPFILLQCGRKIKIACSYLFKKFYNAYVIANIVNINSFNSHNNSMRNVLYIIYSFNKKMNLGMDRSHKTILLC